jgi:WD40 repeat protein
LASGSEDNTVKLWSVESHKNLATLQGHIHHVLSVAFSPDGKYLASGSWDKTVKLWSMKTV